MSSFNRLSPERLARLGSRARTLAVVYLAALFTATHIPVPLDLRVTYLGPITLEDKLVHLSLYAAFTFTMLLGWELTIRTTLQAKHYFAVWLVGTLFAGFDEVTQIPVGRTCDLHDWIADVLGILIGLLAFRLLREKLYGMFTRRKKTDESNPGRVAK